ncbi:hypothetical protein XELAEV_18039496mg [Xenopus laevis]|uniref:Uncharacterized protein n=1 Tax=Xenopus laevis TaxID=8355 RepID=A0A974C7N9_XENLA|nr:hypothetical protein XELAEV_18039496mg [Xenopus laevis]
MIYAAMDIVYVVDFVCCPDPVQSASPRLVLKHKTALPAQWEVTSGCFCCTPVPQHTHFFFGLKGCSPLNELLV